MEVKSGKMKHLFVYGTLMESGLVKQLTGKIFKSEKAVLKGYKRFRVKSETYPAIVKDKNSEVEGLLIQDVDETSMELFVAYEGMQYQKEQISVMVGEKKVKASAFVWDGELDLLTNRT